jgi:hypothetical protein
MPAGIVLGIQVSFHCAGMGSGTATCGVGEVSALPARNITHRDNFSVVGSDNSYFALACVSFHRCRRVECSLLRNFTGIA